MAFIDTARIFVRSGKGGSGSTHFRREKYAPKGGPDGGDGGKGGDVIFRVRENVTSLLPFQYINRYIARDGQAGMGQKKSGRSGKDVIINVPAGTVIFLDDSDEQIADLTTPGEEFVVAKGGKGGLGNVHFKSSTRQAPRIAELGEPGQEFWLRLELRLIADVGLVGLPNAGKSTLLASTTRAQPKIADYPFTTLQPNLGVVEVGGSGGETFVLADIPGLIEGAAQGQGLGHEFLRHVRRTRILVHVLDASGGLEGRDPLDDFRKINSELYEFDETMRDKPMLVALNKIDLSEAQELIPRLRENLADYQIFEISAATGNGVQALMNALGERMQQIREDDRAHREAESARPLRRVYTIGNIDEEAWDVERVSRRHLRVNGVGLERFAAMTNFDLPESVDRFQRVLERAGVFAELIRQGVEDGDTVTIGTFELRWGEDEEKPWFAHRDERREELVAAEEEGFLFADLDEEEFEE